MGLECTEIPIGKIDNRQALILSKSYSVVPIRRG